MKISPIIEVQELLKIYQNPEVMIFDASNGETAQSNYEAEHIQGAFFIDLNTHLADIKDDFSNGGRHPLPSIINFSKTLSHLGIGPKTHVVIYDHNNGSNAAARFWWMLKSVGHKKIQVLNGGFQQAKKEHFPMSSKKENIPSSAESYPADHWILPMIEMNDLERISQDEDYIVVDVRSKERFDGDFEPIDQVAGHIPGAINIPFTENLDEQGLFLQPNVLMSKYITWFRGKDNNHIIVHCGSGVTACHTLLAMDYAGLAIPKLYVGSWSEWSRNNKTIFRKSERK
jgi:thiosulfate/3-mercaptopyruvate sulfurtransferase